MVKNIESDKTKKSTTAKKKQSTKVAKGKSTTKKAEKASSSSKVESKKPTKVKKETKQTLVQAENNYGKTILAAVLIVAIFIGAYFAIKLGNGGNSNYEATEEEVKFKEEYESLNGTTTSSGVTNKEVSIIADNNIVYISLAEAENILEDGTGVIYFGYASSQMCRNAVPVLLEAMQSSDLDKIYYVNLLDSEGNDIRDTYALNDKNKAKKEKKAQDEEVYSSVLTLLANYLDDYVLETDSGKKVNTGEKRLNAPTVVAVVDGEIVGFHEGTISGQIESDDSSISDLTEEEEKSLLKEYTNVISKYLSSEKD